jgi:hypothetical protein
MARTLTSAQLPPLATGATYFPATPISAGSAKMLFAAADATNFNYTPIVSGKTYLLVYNTDTVGHTVTIHSVVDAQNRSGDITAYNVPAGEIHKFGPFTSSPVGWTQTSPAGLWFDCSSALLFVNVETAP